MEAGTKLPCRLLRHKTRVVALCHPNDGWYGLLIGMLDKPIKEEQAPRVDERLVRVVRIIVEEYDGDVRAFVESIRSNVELIQRAEADSNKNEAAWQ